MSVSTRIHWGRVLMGGFLAEVAIFVVAVAVLLLFGERAVLYALPPTSLVMTFLFAVRVGQRIESRFVLHGLLLGVVATLLYVGLTLARPEPFLYLVAHGLKILGGGVGGFVAERRSKVAMAADAERAGAISR